MATASVNGISINYTVQGNGEPLVMITGLGSNQAAFRFQVPAFVGHFKVITYDNRGAGRSDKPKGPYTIRQMADDCVGLMDHLGVKQAHVLGASLGGTIAQEVAINFPGRVSRLVLACTYPAMDAVNGRKPEWDKAINEFIQNGKTPSVRLVFNRWSFRIFGFLAMRAMRRMGETARAGFAAQSDAAVKHNTLDRLPSIKAPTLVIVGTGDKAVRPSSSETMARLIPNAKLVKIKGGSHTFLVENRHEFNRQVLAFLKEG